ncbi:cytochrome C [Novosphingobium sp. BL-8A]|uniref:c-type cytochrome n=1 Tax=Novosphingobium sp. BL-8A TaxID=3127639 RepID=UPI003756684A
MHVKSMIAVIPLALLAACGGSGEEKQSASPASATSPEPVASPAVAAADTAPPAFAICRSCHSVEAGRNGVGPTLHGIVGSKAGDVAGFPFSPALKQSGITWDRQSLDTWLQGPMKMVPGTRMVIAVPDAEKRKAIIDYLEKQK